MYAAGFHNPLNTTSNGLNPREWASGFPRSIVVVLKWDNSLYGALLKHPQEYRNETFNVAFGWVNPTRRFGNSMASILLTPPSFLMMVYPWWWRHMDQLDLRSSSTVCLYDGSHSDRWRYPRRHHRYFYPTKSSHSVLFRTPYGALVLPNISSLLQKLSRFVKPTSDIYIFIILEYVDIYHVASSQSTLQLLIVLLFTDTFKLRAY
jgi:hypothetical protein